MRFFKVLESRNSQLSTLKSARQTLAENQSEDRRQIFARATTARPSHARTSAPRPAMSANSAGSAPVIQTCAPSAASSSYSAARRRRIEMRDDFVEQQHRREAGHVLDQPAHAPAPGGSAAPSARRSRRRRRRCPWRRSVTARSVRCGPSSVRPAAASRARLSRSTAR